MRGLLWGLVGSLGWMQPCHQPPDLVYADSVWLDLPHTATWLEAHRHSLQLREAKSGLPCPKGLLTQDPSSVLLHLCWDTAALRWHWKVGLDTFHLLSKPLPPRRLGKHLTLLRGPCANSPGHPQTIEIMLVFRPRSSDLQAEETAWGWKPFLSEAWEIAILSPLALPHRYSASAVTALGLIVQRFSEKSCYLTEARLYGRKSAFLPRDEVIAAIPRRRLPKDFLTQLRAVWQAQPPYGYVVRINDYYPQSVGEGVAWTELLTGRLCVRPYTLLMPTEDGYSLKAEWIARLQAQPEPRLPLWPFR